MYVTMIMIATVMIVITIFMMAIGYFVQDKALKGTCGGLAEYQKSSQDSVVCASCGKDFSKGEEGCGETPSTV